MGTPTNISEILATLPGGKAEEDDEEPDWLKELEEDEVSKEVCFWVFTVDVYSHIPLSSDLTACARVYRLLHCLMF